MTSKSPKSDGVEGREVSVSFLHGDAAADADAAAAAESTPDFDLDENLLHLGVKGFYPSGLYLIVSFFIFLSPCIYLSAHVSSHTPEHHCRVPEGAEVNRSLPIVTDSLGIESFASCEMFHPNDTFEEIPYTLPASSSPSPPNATSRRIISCDRGWEYKDVVPGETVVADFDLVCSDRWMSGFSTSIFNIGQACGAILVQPLGDRFGRKWMMVASSFGMGLTGILTATVVDGALSFIALKFVMGAFFAGFLLSTFVMQIELYAAKHRMWAGMVVEPIWGLGSAAVGLVAWLFPQWRHFSLAISIPLFLSLFVIPIFPPDSLPWLMVNQKHDKAREYLEKKLEAKGKKLITLKEPLEKKASKVRTVEAESPRVMLSDFQVIKQLVIFAFVSTVNSLVYYALSLMATDLSGDRNLSLFLSGVVEIPGYTLAGVALHFMGRRGPTVLFHVLVGIFMAIVASIQIFAPTPIPNSLDIFSQICYFGAKLAISGSYAIIFLYVPEIFPTNVRSTSVGLVDAVARLGGVVAPYSSYLGSVSHPAVPVFVFAVLALLSAILILFLPECHNETLPDTLEDLKYLVNGTRFWNMMGVRKRRRIRGSKREVVLGDTGV